MSVWECITRKHFAVFDTQCLGRNKWTLSGLQDGLSLFPSELIFLACAKDCGEIHPGPIAKPYRQNGLFYPQSTGLLSFVSTHIYGISVHLSNNCRERERRGLSTVNLLYTISSSASFPVHWLSWCTHLLLDSLRALTSHWSCYEFGIWGLCPVVCDERNLWEGISFVINCIWGFRMRDDHI